MTRPRISLLPLRTPHTWCSLLLSLALLCACGQHKRDPGTNGAFAKAPQTEGATLARISEGGELIIATLSGPDTYFDYQGQGPVLYVDRISACQKPETETVSF